MICRVCIMLANLAIYVCNIYSTALTRDIQVKQRKAAFFLCKKQYSNDYFSALAEMVAKTPKYIF